MRTTGRATGRATVRTTAASTGRDRPDRCPGVLRPWPAEDGALARIRVPGGQLPVAALQGLAAVAKQYGDGRVRLTGRANLQLRGLPAVGGVLAPAVVTAIEAAGLLPSRSHDQARNVLASPQTGRAGGRADLRPVLAALDAAILASPTLAGLPGRFLFTLDDGRGDLVDRHRDLGLIALDADRARLLVGPGGGPVVRLSGAPAALVALAEEFQAVRGSGPDAAWHVDELAVPLTGGSGHPAEALPVGAPLSPLPFGPVPGGTHLAAGEDAVIDVSAVLAAATTPDVVLTPFGGVLIPGTPDLVVPAGRSL